MDHDETEPLRLRHDEIMHESPLVVIGRIMQKRHFDLDEYRAEMLKLE